LRGRRRGQGREGPPAYATVEALSRRDRPGRRHHGLDPLPQALVRLPLAGPPPRAPRPPGPRSLRRAGGLIPSGGRFPVTLPAAPPPPAVRGARGLAAGASLQRPRRADSWASARASGSSPPPPPAKHVRA